MASTSTHNSQNEYQDIVTDGVGRLRTSVPVDVNNNPLAGIGGGPATIADGANVAEGHIADVAAPWNGSDGTATILMVLAALWGKLNTLAGAISGTIMKVFTQDLTASGNITAAQPVIGTPVTNATITLALGSGQGTWSGQVLGTGFSATSTLLTEYSKDGGATWQSTTVRTAAGVVSSFVGGATVQFRGSCASWTHVRVRCTPFQAGDTIAVVLTASIGADVQTNAAQDGTDPVGTNAGTQAGSTTAGVGIRGWLSTLAGLFQNGLAKIQSHTNANRNGGVLHRNAIAAVDKVASAGTVTISAVTEAGSTLSNAQRYATVIPGNRWGPAGKASPTIVTVTPTLNQAVRLAFAAVTGADYYDIFLSTSSTGPLWVGRITETQRAAGGIISSVGVYSAGGAINSIDVGIDGTGLACSVAPFINSNAYTPATPTAINCAGYSLLHLHVKLALTDLRSAPTLAIAVFLQDQTSTGDWFQTQLVTLNLLNANGQCLEQDIVVQLDGATGAVVLIDTISGQGAAVSIWSELA